jgi:hypothetical protein
LTTFEVEWFSFEGWTDRVSLAELLGYDSSYIIAHLIRRSFEMIRKDPVPEFFCKKHECNCRNVHSEEIDK